MKRYFILGGGVAALSAAKAIRENDPSGLVVIISGEASLPYARPMLTKVLMRETTAEDLALETAAWYDAPGRDIVLLTGRRVSVLDLQAKTITLEDGLVFGYDKLVYALGARCFLPPFDGNDRQNVIAIRTMQDVQRVREIARTAAHAVVIGGGVLGLEAAWALREGGLKVTVLEHGGQLMPRQIDEEAAAHLTRCMAESGVELVTHADTACVDDTGVTLRDGRHYPADLVIVSAGVRANQEIAAAAGIAVGRKIIVNARMETSVQDVYAAGDCAECGMSYALYAEAAEMGRVAGTNAAGGCAEYRVIPRALIFHGFGTEIYAIGDVGRNPVLKYEVGAMPGARYYSVDGRVVGVILVGDTSRAMEAEQLVLENA